MRILLMMFLAISNPLLGAERDALVGTWKLVSWEVIVENQPPQHEFGEHPKGFAVLTPEGRLIVLTTAEQRRAGMGASDRAALHKSMVSYSGRYRVEGHDFITTVEVSWNGGMARNRGVISESKATNSSSSRHPPRAYCFLARQRCAG